MIDFKPYSRNRLVLDKGDYVVIKPVDDTGAVPLSCPVCDELFKTRDDEEAYALFQCCNLCAIAWAYPKRNDWEQGWRPDDDDIERVKSLRPRPVININVD